MTRFLDEFRKADSLRENCSFREALSAYRALLRERLALLTSTGRAFDGSDVVLMERVSELAVIVGQASAGASILEYSRHILENAGNAYAADWASVQASSAHLVAGNWPAARNALLYLGRRGIVFEKDFSDPAALARSVESLHPTVGKPDLDALTVRLLLEIGRQHAACGQYRAAILALQDAWHYFAESRYPLLLEAKPFVQAEMASAKLEFGDLKGCRQLLPITTRPGIAFTNVISRDIEGKAALLEGDLSPALRAFEEVWKACSQLGVQHASDSAAFKLAHVLLLLNQTTRASRIGEMLLRTAERRADSLAQEQAKVLLRLADARGRSVAETVAIAPSVTELWDQTARPIRPFEGSHDELATMPNFNSSSSRSFLDLYELRSLTFFWLLARQDWRASHLYLGEMDRVFGETDSMLIVARRHSLEGLLLYYQNRMNESKVLLSLAREAMHELGLVHDEWQVLRALSWIATSQSDSNEEQLRTAADNLLRRMEASLEGPERTIFLLNKWTEDEERLAKRLQVTAKLYLSSLHSRGLKRWIRRFRCLRDTADLLQNIDEYRGGIISHSVLPGLTGKGRARSSWIKVAFQFWRTSALIRLFVLPDRVAIVTICRAKARIGIVAVSRMHVRESVAAVHQAVKRGDSEAFHQIMQDLSTELNWDAALAELPNSVRRIVILPDDSLHGLPIAALPASKKLTIERCALRIGFGVSSPEDGAKLETGCAMAAAYPVAIKDGENQYPDLANAEIEAGAFEKWCHERNVRVVKLGVSHNKLRVLSELAQSDFVHVVCHGMFRPERPDASGLLIASRDNRYEVLSIRDLASVDLSRLKLGAFTSCWAADSFVLPGRFVVSLPEVCWRSGARSILASLWAVHDEIAASMLQSFYSHLKSNTPEEALRLAQLAALSSSLPGHQTIDTSDPFYWAGFQVYGDAKIEQL